MEREKNRAKRGKVMGWRSMGEMMPFNRRNGLFGRYFTPMASPQSTLPTRLYKHIIRHKIECGTTSLFSLLGVVSISENLK
jgi:hypothetical protein